MNLRRPSFLLTIIVAALLMMAVGAIVRESAGRGALE
jgi:hypothetical protein